MFNNKFFILIVVSGVLFIIIGIISIIDSFSIRKISINDNLIANETRIISPDMEISTFANLTLIGDYFNVTVINPDKTIIESNTYRSKHLIHLRAEQDGEYIIQIKNIAKGNLSVNGELQSKADSIAFSGSMILIITGVILSGTAIRFRNR